MKFHHLSLTLVTAMGSFWAVNEMQRLFLLKEMDSNIKEATDSYCSCFPLGSKDFIECKQYQLFLQMKRRTALKHEHPVFDLIEKLGIHPFD